MKRLIAICSCVLVSTLSFSQQETKKKVVQDTLVTHLGEITIVGRRSINSHKQEKVVSSLDAYLEKSNRITMVKRGNYAWEPSLNNMNSERLSVTIDGMQIYGACTDKMDPVTSYVDVSNLEKIDVNSGQTGSENAHSIGGSIDLKLPDSKYHDSGMKTSIDTGFETNGNSTSTGLDVAYSGDSFFLSTDGMYRKSGNYEAGGSAEVAYSQFEKYNISLQAGYEITEENSLEAHVIYDKATDVGYPALPMDVSLAEASIFSVTHMYKNKDKTFHNWETKLYYNTITHVMDDSKRPDVPVRMDMPGWSDTFGFYSKVRFNDENHKFKVSFNAHYNRSLAEMTMYPNNPDENVMFMYTWPDVRTLYSGVFLKDDLYLGKGNTLSFTARLGLHKNVIKEKVGLQSLQIFYPDLSDSKDRILTSVSTNYMRKQGKLDFNFGLGYGERAPSVSEGYGFFLFNSFDNYDYIGNPNLKSEKSIEVNFKTNFKHKNLKIGLESSYFNISNYIIGKEDASLSSMTIGANGVRLYEALRHAVIFNAFINTGYTFSKQFSANAIVGYNYGKGSDDDDLPLISPLSYKATINYKKKKFNLALQLYANGNQTNYSSNYGEDETPGFTILNFYVGNYLLIGDQKMVFKCGVENIFDKNYSTYSDWNNIARQGRNFYVNASYVIQ